MTAGELAMLATRRPGMPVRVSVWRGNTAWGSKIKSPVISRGQLAYADGKRQRLQVKPESIEGQGENLSRL